MFNGRADSSRYRPRSLSTSEPANACVNGAVAGAAAVTPVPLAAMTRREPTLLPPSATRIPGPIGSRISRAPAPTHPSSANTRLTRPPSLTSAHLSSSRLQGDSFAPRSAAATSRSRISSAASRLSSTYVNRNEDFDRDDGNQGDGDSMGGHDAPDDAASSASSTAFVSGDSHIITAVRVRPMFASERKAGYRRIIDMGVQTSSTGNWTRIVNPLSLSNSPNPAGADEGVAMRTHATQFSHDFFFDFSFWSYDQSTGRSFATQSTIYEELGTFAIESAWQGYNCSIFAYGQTSAGKTFTMMGDTAEVRTSAPPTTQSQELPVGSHPRQGVIPRICRGLFDKIENTRMLAQVAGQSCRFSVQVSYVEVYHERVYDLLAGAAMTGKESLKVRENPEDGVFVENAKYRSVTSFEDIKALIDEGNRVRSVAATNLNQRSSRSHAILTLYVKQHSPSVRISAASLTSTSWMADPTTAGVGNTVGLTMFAKKSKICLVDLAGSERADISGASGQRLKEAGSINRSLSTLADVISALSKRSSVLGGGATTGGAHSAGNTSAFVPYRNSVLTRLLKESLGGNAKTVMLAAISPCCSHYEETLSTLKYIERAKNVVNTVKINTENSLELVQELRREISELKAKLQHTSKVPAPFASLLIDPSQQPHELPIQTDQVVYRCDIPDHAEGAQVHLIQEKNIEESRPSVISFIKAVGPECESSGGSPQYPTIKFNEADKAKMEREIAKLKLQLKKKDKELQQQQQEMAWLRDAENQRQATQDEHVSMAIRRQSLMLNLVSIRRRLVFQRIVRAFERWRVSGITCLSISPLPAPDERTYPQEQDESLASDEKTQATSSLHDIATSDNSSRSRWLPPQKKRSNRSDSARTLNTLCLSVVDTVLFDGQIEVDGQGVNQLMLDLPVVVPQAESSSTLNSLEALAASSNDGHDDVMTLAQALEICLSPYESPKRSTKQESTSTMTKPSTLVLDLIGVNDFELDRELRESIDAAAAVVEAFEEKHKRDILPIKCQERGPGHHHKATAAISKYKQQVQARTMRCVDVVDLARKYLGPTDRRLRVHNDRYAEATKDSESDLDRSISSTATERQLLKYIDRCFVIVCHRLEEFRTSILGWSVDMNLLSDLDEFEGYLQRKVAWYERVEALLTVFCLHIVRRVCDQLCAPVTMALINAAESINDQLSSFQSQLNQPELWRDTLISTRSLSQSVSVDEPVAIALVQLYGLTERIRATWSMIDQRHRALELHLRSQHNLVEVSTLQVSKLKNFCGELESRLAEVNRRHQEQLIQLTQSDVEISSITRHSRKQAEEHMLELEALRRELQLAEAKMKEMELIYTSEKHDAARTMSEIEDRLRAAEERHASAQSELLVVTSHAQDVEAQLSSMTEQWRVSEDDRVAVSEEKARLSEEKSRLSEQVSMLTASESGLIAEKMALAEQVSSLSAESAELRLRAVATEEELSRVSSELASAHARASELESQHAALSVSSEASRLELSVRLESELSSSKVLHEEAVRRVSELEVEVRAAEERHASAQSELLVVTSHAQDVEAQLSSMTEQWRVSEDDRVAVSEEKARLSEEKSRLSEQVSMLTASESGLIAEKTALAEQVSSLSAESAELRLRAVATEEELSRVSSELASAHARASELESQHAALSVSSEASRLELSVRLESELSSSKVLHEEAVRRVSELEVEVRAAEERHASAQSELLVVTSHAQDVEAQLSSMTEQWRVSEDDRVAVSEEKARLSEEKSRLSEQVSMLTASESGLIAEKTALAEQVSSLSAESAELRLRAVATEEELSRVSSELASAHARASELESQHAALSVSSEASRLELSVRLESELSSSKVLHEEAVRRVSELEVEVRAAEERHASAQSELLVVTSHAQDVEAQLSSMTEQWRVSEDDRVAVSEEKARLSEEKSRLSEQVSMLTASESGLIAEKMALAEQVSSLSAESAELRLRAVATEEELSRVSSELASAHARASELESQHAALSVSSEASRLELSVRLESELSSSKVLHEEAVRRVSELEVEVRAAEERHASAQSELLVVTSHAQDVEAQLSSMTEQWRVSEDDRVAVSEEKARLSEEKSRLSEQVSMLTASESGLIAEKMALAEQVSSLSAESAELRLRAVATEEELSRVSSELASAHARASELESQHAALSVSSEASRLELSVRLESELSSSKVLHEEAVRRVSELEVEVRAAEERHASAQSELLVVTSHAQDVEAQLSSMTEQWRVSEDDRVAVSEEKARLSEEKSRLSEQVSMLTASESGLIAEKMALAEQVSSLSAESAELRLRAVATEEELSRVSSELASAHARASELESQHAALSVSSEASRLELSVRLESELSSSKVLHEEAVRRVSELEVEVRAAEERHASAQSELLVVTSHAQDVEAQLSSMTEQWRVSEDDRVAVSEEKARLSEEKSRLSEQVSMLTASESGLIAEKMALAEQVSSLSAESAELRLRAVATEEELSRVSSELASAHARASELESQHAALSVSSEASRLELSVRLESELSSSKVLHEEAVRHVSELEVEVRAAEERHASAQSELLVVTSHAQDVEAQLSSMTEQWRVSEDDRVAVSEEKARLSEEKSRLSEQVSMLTASESGLIAEKMALAEQVSSLSAESAELRLRAVATEEELSRVSSELASAHARASELESQHAALSVSSEASRLELSVRLESELSSSKVLHEEAVRRVSELEVEVRAAEERHASAQSELLVVTSHAQDVEAQLSSMTEQWRVSEDDRVAVSEEKARLSEEKSRLSEQVSMLTASESGLIAEKMALAEQVSSLSAESAELRLRAVATEEELSRVSSELASAHARASELESQHAALSVSSEASRLELSVRLESELSSSKVLHEEAVRHVSELEVEVRAAEERHASAQSELLVVTSHAQDVEAQLSSMTEQWRVSEDDRVAVSEEKARLSEEKSRLSEQVSMLTASESGLIAEKMALAEQVSSLSAESAELRLRAVATEEELSRVSSELASAHARASELESQHAALSVSSEASRLELSVRLESELSSSKVLHEEAVRRVSELEVEVRAAEERHASAQSELLVVTSHAQDVEAQLSSMTEQWRVSEDDRVAVSEEKARLSEEKSRLSEQVSMLTASESGLIAEKMALAEQVSSLSAESAELRLRAVATEEELSRVSSELASAHARASELESQHAALSVSSEASRLELSVRLESELSSSKVLHEEAVRRVSELEVEVRAAEERHASAQSELLVVTSHAQDVEAQLSSMTEQWRVSEDDRVAVSEEKARLSEEKSRLSEQVSMLTASESGLIAEKMALAEQVSSLSAESAELRLRAVATEEELSRVSSELASAHARASELESQHAALSVSSEASRLELSVRLESELSSSKVLHEEAVRRVSELEVEVRAAEERHASAQSELLVVTSHAQDVEAQLSSMTEQWRVSEDDRVAVSEEKARLSEEKSRLSEQVSMLTASESGLIAEKMALAEQVSSLSAESAELRLRAVATEEELSRVSSELASAHARASELESQHAALSVSSEASRLELSVRLESELSSSKVLHEEAVRRVSELEVEVRAAEERHALSQSALLTEIEKSEKLTQTVGDLTSRISELEDQWTFAADMQREAVARLEIVDEERREIEMALEGTEERYSNLASEFWSQSLLLARVEDDLVKHRASEAKAVGELTAREDAFAALLVDRTIEITNHNAQICSLRDEIVANGAVLAQLNQDIIEMTTKHLVDQTVSRQLECDLQHANQEVKEWSEKYEKLAQTYVTQRAQLFESVGEVKALQQTILSLRAGAEEVESARGEYVPGDMRRLEETLKDAQSRYNSLRSACGDSDSVDWEGMYNGLMSDMHVRIQELQDQLEEVTARAAETEHQYATPDSSRATTDPVMPTIESGEMSSDVRQLQSQLKTEQARSEMLSREVAAKAKDLQELAEAVANAQMSGSAELSPDTGMDDVNQAEQQAQKLILRHLNSLDLWFSQTIAQDDASPSKSNERRLGSIAETVAPVSSSHGLSDDDHDDEDEEVWPVGIATKLFKKPSSPRRSATSRQFVDATTETDSDPPSDKARSSSAISSSSLDGSAHSSELAQLRTTILKLKATIDEKEGLIQFMDERLSYFENLRFK